MKRIMLFILLCSCSNLLVPDLDLYNSVYLNGASWIEIENNFDCDNGLRVMDQDFSLEIFFSGSNDRENAGTLFSIIGKETENYNDINCNNQFEPDLGEIDSDGNLILDEYDTINPFIVLAVTNEPSDSSILTIYINDERIDVDESIDSLLTYVNFLDTSTFYLLQVLSDGDSLSLFLNNNQIVKSKADIMLQGASLMIGAAANSNEAKNIWNGYIDEVRLWDGKLSDTIRESHYNFPHKLSESMQYESLSICNLIGIWTFNYSTPQYNIIDQKCDFIESLHYNPCYSFNCDSLSLDANLWTMPGHEAIYSKSGFSF